MPVIPDRIDYGAHGVGADEITFGRFRLDARARVLLRDDHPLRLARRPLDILCALANARGEIVSKDDLLAQLWPGRIVEEGNIHTHVSALRKALDEQGEGHNYIITVPGRGYRLIGTEAPDLQKPPAARLSSLVGDAAPTAADLDEAPDRRRIIERRHLTVISCELIGMTRLAAQLDPEELSVRIEALHRRCSETIAGFGGT